MSERPYPVNRHGMPLPLELVSELPETRLDLERHESWNNHHMAYTAVAMGRLAITQVWRDLEGMQRRMPIDVHGKLHQLFGPPPMPTLHRVMERLERAKMTGEQLKTWDPDQRVYVLHNFTNTHWLHLQQEYNEIGGAS